MSISKKIGIIAGGVAVVLLVLWYYQSQGLIKVFPTSQDSELKKVLEIDESKFSPAEGLSEEVYQAKIKELYEQREAVLADPTDAQAWLTFANLKKFLNDNEGAVLAWQKVLEYQPLNFLAAQNLGNTYQYFLKDYPKAEFYYKKALEILPDYTLAYQGLMDLYRFNWKEKQDEFEPTVLSAIQNDQANAASYYSALVEFFAKEGRDLDKAEEYLQEVQRLSPATAKELRTSYPALQ